jgi:hypothetical protein
MANYAYATVNDRYFRFGYGTDLCIRKTGNVGIGKTNPSEKLHVQGNVIATGNITAYYSDQRLKEKTAPLTNVLEKLDDINVFKYVENDLARSLGFDNKKEQIGLSAQEVSKHFPQVATLAPFDTTRNDDNEIVSKSGENYMTLQYERIVPILLQSIKELKERVIYLESKL